MTVIPDWGPGAESCSTFSELFNPPKQMLWIHVVDKTNSDDDSWVVMVF